MFIDAFRGIVIMDKKKVVIISMMILISSTLAVVPTIAGTEDYNVTGLVYINGELTDGEGVAVTLSIPEMDNITDDTIVNGTYNISFNATIGDVGYLTVQIDEVSYMPTPDSFEVDHEPPYTFEINLSVVTGSEPPYEPTDPSPEDGAINVTIDAILSWTGGDPDGDPVTYDIYFGTTSPPEKIEGNQTETTYDPGTLDYETTYYWKIIAWDDSGESTEGAIWEFTTIEQQELIIEIIQPEENYFYIRNTKLLQLNDRTFIYGSITIIANVTSNADIERVEFLIDGEPKHTDYEAPYEFNWSQILSFQKTIKVIVYDTEGNNATDEIVVFKWRLHPVLLMAGAAFVLNPNTKLLRSPRGYTTIRGFIFNPKHDGKTLTFRAVRLHYTKVRPLGTESGVIILKKCTIKTNTPDMQLAMGPFGLFSWIFCVYRGTSLDQARFFRAR